TVGMDPQSWDPETGTLEAFMCEDLSNVRLLAPDGTDRTPVGLSRERETGVRITGLPDDPRPEMYEPYPYLDQCS
ncbi:MAG: hypothetical protein ABWZ77_05940, partial [Naasia sp.]